MGELVAATDRLQHVRRFLGGRRASRARRNGDLGHAQHQGLALDALEAQIEVVRQPVLRRSVSVNALETCRDLAPQSIAQCRHAHGVCRALGTRDRRRFAEPHDPGHVQRARAQAVLLAAAVEDRLDADRGPARSHVERPDALGAVHLVTRDREQVDGVAFHVHIELAERLRCVAMEEHAARATRLADRRHRLDRADLVVGVHHAHQHGPVGERSLHVAGIEAAVAIDGKHGDPEAFLLECPQRIEDRLVLGGLGDDVIAAPAQRPRRADQRQVVALGGAAGEDDGLRFARADQLGDSPAGALHRLLGLPAEGVGTRGRIAVDLDEGAGDRGDHPWVDGCRGVVIEVDRWTSGTRHENDLPQPHVDDALGFSILNPAP